MEYVQTCPPSNVIKEHYPNGFIKCEEGYYIKTDDKIVYCVGNPSIVEITFTSKKAEIIKDLYNLKRVYSDTLEIAGDKFLTMCHSLEIVKLNSLKKLGHNFMSGWYYSLVHLELNSLEKFEENQHLPDMEEVKTVKMNSLTEAYHGFLSDSYKLENFEAENLSVILNYFLSGCSSLKNIKLTNVTKIGTHAFMWCTSLEKVHLSDNITEIGSYAFAYCKSIKEIYISGCFSKIDDENFLEDSRPKKITILSRTPFTFKGDFIYKMVPDPQKYFPDLDAEITIGCTKWIC